MTSSDKWLQQALLQYQPPEELGHNLTLAPGQVRVVFGNTEIDNRLSLVMSVDGDNNFCEIMLIHSELSMATDVDLVIEGDNDGINVPMVIETDCHSVVWMLQLGECVGVLSDEQMEAVFNVKEGVKPVDASLYSGMPLAGRFDLRWGFKTHEGNVIRSLSEDCINTVLNKQPVTFLDPGVLSPQLLKKAKDPISVLLNVIEVLDKKAASDTMALNELGALDKQFWLDLDPAVGDQIFSLLQLKLLEQSLSPIDETQSVDWSNDRKPEAGNLHVPVGALLATTTYTQNTTKKQAKAKALEHNYLLLDEHAA